MGDLDDAIREHLELKRKHGASDEEVAIKESEAQRQGALPTDPGARPAPPEPEPVASQPTEPEPAPSARTEPPSELPEERVADPFESAAPLADELDPDEVLPEEALEPEVREDEDLLQEAPEFLEEMPEQDRLWFEQRPPKDFDFGD